MSPKLIVRIAAALTALPAVAVLGILAMAMVQAVSHEASSPSFYKKLGALGLLTIVPGLFVWAAIQTWRGQPKGIVSLSSGWMAALVICSGFFGKGKFRMRSGPSLGPASSCAEF